MVKVAITLLALTVLPACWASAAEYRPGLGDLMTTGVQPRHTKLGLAGQAKNWPYATYELGELRETLDDVAETQPTWNGFAVAEGIAAMTKAPLVAVEAAIKAGDAARFNDAYGRLTAACNQCHQAAGMGVIVIRVPSASPFPDQDFRPVGK